MRTTVDLPPALHRRALELAQLRNQSLSATLAELVTRGLGQLDEPVGALSVKTVIAATAWVHARPVVTRHVKALRSAGIDLVDHRTPR